MVKDWIDKYFRSSRLFLTLLILVFAIIAFVVSYVVRELTMQETGLIGTIFGAVVIYVSSETKRKS